MRSLLLTPLLLAPLATADEVVLDATADNTLYEDDQGDVSNGAGFHLFAGKTNADDLRRALLRFDVRAAIPAGATVLDVRLVLNQSKASNNLPIEVRMHRVLADWGESSSAAGGEEGKGDDAEPGDATWLFRFFPNSPWAAVGGDFAPTASAVTPTSGMGSFEWSGPGLVADVQAWLDGDAEDFGWLLIAPETGPDTARRFDSRENLDPAARPRLTVHFDPPSGCPQPLPSQVAVRAGTPANPIALLPVDAGGPVIGSSWSVAIDHAAFVPNALVDVVVVGLTATEVPLPPVGTLLCGLGPIDPFVAATVGAPVALALPDNCALVGLDLCVQGGSFDAAGALLLTNALDLTVGTE